MEDFKVFFRWLKERKIYDLWVKNRYNYAIKNNLYMIFHPHDKSFAPSLYKFRYFLSSTAVSFMWCNTPEGNAFWDFVFYVFNIEFNHIHHNTQTWRFLQQKYAEIQDDVKKENQEVIDGLLNVSTHLLKS
jgi:hypothetical protein